MSRFWSELARGLSPYVPGEQPQIPGLIKLNTNESPFGPSPKAIEAIRAAAADTLRLYPDPQATRLREVLAAYHNVAPEQIFVGNGSDEVLAHAFAALLKQSDPLLFPDVTYSFYPVYCRLLGIDHTTVPLDAEMRVRVDDYLGRTGPVILANPNAPTGIALPRTEIARLVSSRPEAAVVIDEAYVDFGADSAIPLIRDHPHLLVVHTMSKSRALAGLRVGYAIGDAELIQGLTRVKDSFNSYPGGPPRPARSPRSKTMRIFSRRVRPSCGIATTSRPHWFASASTSCHQARISSSLVIRIVLASPWLRPCANARCSSGISRRPALPTTSGSQSARKRSWRA